MIDVGVWFGVLCALILVAAVTVQITTPPSQQMLQQQAVAAENARFQANIAHYQTQCLSDADLLAYVPDELHQKYCGCISFYTTGGTHPLAQGRPLKCLQEVSRDFANRPNIEADFLSVFPAACNEIEQQVTGKMPDHLGSPFCGCLQKRIGDDKARMAEYVVAGSERTDGGQGKADVTVCKRQTLSHG